MMRWAWSALAPFAIPMSFQKGMLVMAPGHVSSGDGGHGLKHMAHRAVTLSRCRKHHVVPRETPAGLPDTFVRWKIYPLGKGGSVSLGAIMFGIIRLGGQRLRM